MNLHNVLPLGLTLGLLSLAACGDSGSAETSGGPTTAASDTSTGTGTGTGDVTGELRDQAPDFMLIDVNPNSASFEQAVSPRDYLEKVSGWYFAHAT